MRERAEDVRIGILNQYLELEIQEAMNCNLEVENCVKFISVARYNGVHL